MSSMNAVTVETRKVSAFLALGIIVAPLIFVWFTVRSGYSTTARVVSFIWLIIAFALSFVMGVGLVARQADEDPWDGKVAMQVELNGSDCKDPNPIAVTITNNADVELLAYSWSISVKAKGHSTELAEHGRNLGSDLILKPGEQAVFCQAIPTILDSSYPLSELEFTPDHVWVESPETP